MYVLRVQYSCAVVSVFLFGGKANLVRFTLFYSTLLALTEWQTDWLTDRGTISLRPEKKKFQSSVWRVCQFLVLAGNWQFFCCGGKFSLRPEKKKFQSSVWWVRNPVLAITTGKKRYSRLSGGLCYVTNLY